MDLKDINKEIKAEKFVYSFYMDQLKKHGYHHNFFLTDLFERQLLKKSKVVNGDYIRKKWLSYLSDNKTDKINVYIGVPYCYSKCYFCIYHKGIVKNKRQVKEYAECLINQIHLFKEVLKKRKFHNLYFGGGTPSLFDNTDLSEILEIFFRYASFLDTSEKTFELNPQSTTFNKLKILKQAGFNRVSFGVQSLNLNVLKSINRDYQNEDMITKCITNCRELGFEQYNTDMIIGLYKDTKKTFTKSFKRLLDLQPTTVRLYKCQPTVSYLKKYFNGSLGEFQKHFNELRECMPQIIKYAVSKGYESPDERILDAGNAASMLFLLSSAQKIPDVYHFNVDCKGSVLGLGHHASSYIKNKIRYFSNPPTLDPIKSKFSMIEFSEAEEMQRFVFEIIVNISQISKSNFKQNFKKELNDVFSEPLEKLKQLGQVREEGDQIYYLPKTGKDKFFYGLFFIGKEKIIEAINKYYSDNLIKVVVGKEEALFRIDYVFTGESAMLKINQLNKENTENIIHKEILNSFKELSPRTGDPVEFREIAYKEINKHSIKA